MLSKIFGVGGSFRNNVLTLITGTAAAQALPVVFSPLLTRLYSPEQFGLFALFVAFSSIFAVLSTGRYELAIILPEKHKKAMNLLILATSLNLFLSLLLFIFIFSFRTDFEAIAWINNSILDFLPLGLLLIGLFQSLTYWFNRVKKYRELSFSRVWQAVFMVSFQLLFPVLFDIEQGLIVGYLIGLFLSIIILVVILVAQYRQYLRFDLKSLLNIGGEYIQFPKFLVFSGFLNVASGQSPIILINKFFTSTYSGYYSLTLRVIAGPMGIIARAIGDVFRQEASEVFSSNGDCTDLFKGTLKKLLLISVLPFSIFYLIADELFVFVFGEAWAVAGVFAKILTPMFFFQFISSPLSSMYIIANKQREDLYLQIAIFSSAVGSFLLGVYFNQGIEVSLILFSSFYSLIYLINIYITYQFSKGS